MRRSGSVLSPDLLPPPGAAIASSGEMATGAAQDVPEMHRRPVLVGPAFGEWYGIRDSNPEPAD